MTTFKAYAKAHSNIRWSSAPDYLELKYTRGDLIKWENILSALKEIDVSMGEVNRVDVAMYFEALITENEENLIQIPGEDFFYINEDPEYSIGFEVLRLYPGLRTITAVLFLKHTDEEIWADFNLDELLKNAKSI